jgi:uncharacterized membrane protein YeaQ/YmgE (transglycosylase-associated protein family)
MGIIIWLAIGLGAGAIAKMLTPQQESGGWISSIIIGILGAWVGNFITGFLGLERLFDTTWLGQLICATGGALLLLWVYHKFLAKRLNLPI